MSLVHWLNDYPERWVFGILLVLLMLVSGTAYIGMYLLDSGAKRAQKRLNTEIHHTYKEDI